MTSLNSGYNSNVPLLTIVLVNWNGVHHLKKFLPLIFQSSFQDFKVFIVDNASSDESIAYVQENFPQVQVIVLDKNYGFAQGNNLAIPFVQTPYALLLNTDVEVTPHWLEPLVEAMEKDKTLAAVQPKILSYHEKNKFEYAGASGGLVDLLCYPLCRGRILNITEEDVGQYNDEAYVFWASGACMLIRTSVIHQIGLFDSKLFAHMEEIDFCWRAQNAGYTIKVIPSSVVYHVGGGTLAHGSPRKIFLNIRNSLVVMTKNLPLQEVFFKVFIRLCLDGIAAIRGLFTGEPRLVWLVFKAHFAYYALLPHAVQQRKKISRKISLRKLKGVVPQLMIWNFFIRKKTKFSEWV